ncbi:MAG: alcohol dehydrogenase catalytic domain-containing protein [Candidatus Brocadiia bacterium]
MHDTMRAAQLVEPEVIEIAEIPVPEPGPGQVLIRVRAVGVCGSDVSIFRGNFQAETRLPYVLGHEFAGEIAALGADVKDLEVGQRVACRPDRPCGECEWCKKGETNVCPNVRFAASHGVPGCLCDYYVVDAFQVLPMGDAAGFVEASICEPTAIGLHIVENLVRPEGGETYAIIGAGPDGLTTMFAARQNGASRIFSSDLMPERLEAARRMGADATCNAAEDDFVDLIREETDGRGVDVAIEATGAVPAIQQVYEVTSIHGRGVILGIPPTDMVEVNCTAARRKELTVTSARRTVGKYRRALDFIESGELDTDILITHRFPFEQTQTAFEYVRDRRDGVLKAVIEL